jgi:hypothetical protein
MNPIISAALAEDHRHTLQAQAARSRRAAVADLGLAEHAHAAHARQVVSHPLVSFHGWLARGYL